MTPPAARDTGPLPFDDPIGAFCRHTHVALAGAPSGPLAGLSFGVKDVFHIAGARTGFGHPDWLRTHEPADVTATAVQRLLDAGARMIGKTHTDELAYSLTGENVHYGTPLNVRAPDRIPGGSSNGSAAAVAAGLVDFALGTDCGGSVRLPASYCGILGFRPTVGRVSLDGVIPFGPPFDVVGWFARDPEVLERVGRVLLDDSTTEPAPPRRLLVATDAFGLVEPRVAGALAPAVAEIARRLGPPVEVTVSAEGLPAWFETFRVLQAAAIWANHGEWITRTRPAFGPGIKERFEWAARVAPADVDAATARHRAIRARLDAVVGAGDVLCLPTSPRVAPRKQTPVDDIEVRYRHQAMHLLCLAGLGGLPQVSLPLAELDGLPLGLSLVGARGADLSLLALARRLVAAPGPVPARRPQGAAPPP
ncbi:MAG TPA: amidase [Methylomirabilota bacterium]|nr:amidase [Methylomirabilota bacterium]